MHVCVVLFFSGSLRPSSSLLPFLTISLLASQAEIKHGRLAMLAALAWPLAEEIEPLLVEVSSATPRRTGRRDSSSRL